MNAIINETQLWYFDMYNKTITVLVVIENYYLYYYSIKILVVDQDILILNLFYTKKNTKLLLKIMNYVDQKLMNWNIYSMILLNFYK